jgi:hypothetical protein
MRTTTITTYGAGGYDPTKPNNNVISVQEIPIPTPETITPAQCRVMLATLELLDTVEGLIATVPLASIWWEYALEIRRDNQYVEMIGQALGWDTEQIDDFFIDASQIQ